MKKLALGIVTAAALFAVTAVPAMAQVEFYAGPGGFDVELGGRITTAAPIHIAGTTTTIAARVGSPVTDGTGAIFTNGNRAAIADIC